MLNGRRQRLTGTPRVCTSNPARHAVRNCWSPFPALEDQKRVREPRRPAPPLSVVPPLPCGPAPSPWPHPIPRTCTLPLVPSPPRGSAPPCGPAPSLWSCTPVAPPPPRGPAHRCSAPGGLPDRGGGAGLTLAPGAPPISERPVGRPRRPPRPLARAAVSQSPRWRGPGGGVPGPRCGRCSALCCCVSAVPRAATAREAAPGRRAPRTTRPPRRTAASSTSTASRGRTWCRATGACPSGPTRAVSGAGSEPGGRRAAGAPLLPPRPGRVGQPGSAGPRPHPVPLSSPPLPTSPRAPFRCPRSLCSLSGSSLSSCAHLSSLRGVALHPSAAAPGRRPAPLSPRPDRPQSGPAPPPPLGPPLLPSGSAAVDAPLECPVSPDGCRDGPCWL